MNIDRSKLSPEFRQAMISFGVDPDTYDTRAGAMRLAKKTNLILENYNKSIIGSAERGMHNVKEAANEVVKFFKNPFGYIPNKVGEEVGEGISAYFTKLFSSPTTWFVLAALIGGLIAAYYFTK